MKKNLLTQLRLKGLSVTLVRVNNKLQLNVTPWHLIKGEARYWLISRKKELYSLLKQETQLKKLITQVGHHDHWSEEEITAVFLDTIKTHALDTAIASYQITAQRQTGIIPDHYTQAVFCKGCQKSVNLWPECPTEVLSCPYCPSHLKKESL